MRKATKADKDRVVDIMYRAYRDNPSFLWIVKPGPNEIFEKRIKWLCEFCFDVIEPIGGVYITSTGNGICMVYHINDRKEGFFTYLLQLRLALRVIGLDRSMEIMQREKYIKSNRPKGNYLYFWILAVDPDVRGFKDMQEIRDEIFSLSEKLNVPIYAETTVEKNRTMYTRYGFREYHHWAVPGKDVNIYFMRREPGTVEERNKKE